MQAKMTNYYVDEDFCKTCSVNLDFDLFVMYHLCEPVKNDLYGIVGFVFLHC